MLKKILPLLFIILLLGISNVYAGPFLRINSVDYNSHYPDVQAVVSVSNADRTAINGLAEENIRLYEDGYLLNYVRVKQEREENQLLYLVFSLDTSKSISPSFMQKIKTSAKEIISNTKQNEKIAIYRFNDEVLMLNSFTNNQKKLNESIDSLNCHGQKTKLYDCLYDSMRLLARTEEKSRRAIVVFTDGKDEGSSLKMDDVVAYSRQENIPIYIMCIQQESDLATLSRLAKLTGGRLVSSSNIGELAKMYNQIVGFINSRYIIKYRTALKSGPKEHKLEARLQYGSLRDYDSQTFVIKNQFLKTVRGFPLYFWVLIGIVLLLILFIIILLPQKRKKYKADKQEDCNLQKAKLAENFAEEQLRKQFYDYQRAIMLDEERQENFPLFEEEEKKEEIVDPASSYCKVWLVEKSGPHSGKKYPIYWDEITLGRSKENTIVIADPAVSAHHAKIKLVNNRYYLFDLVSEHGVFLNDSKMLRPKPLYDWDEISLGHTHFLFRGSKFQ